ncbi:MAG: hypothetical protein AAF612_08035 [Planctomycetota bacterium]
MQVTFLDADGAVVQERGLQGRVHRGAFVTDRRFSYKNMFIVTHRFEVGRVWVSPHLDASLCVFPDRWELPVLLVLPVGGGATGPSDPYWRRFGRIESPLEQPATG